MCSLFKGEGGENPPWLRHCMLDNTYSKLGPPPGYGGFTGDRSWSDKPGDLPGTVEFYSAPYGLVPHDSVGILWECKRMSSASGSSRVGGFFFTYSNNIQNLKRICGLKTLSRKPVNGSANCQAHQPNLINQLNQKSHARINLNQVNQPNGDTGRGEAGL